MFGLTTTRRLHAELAAAKAETDRQRKRADQAEERATTAEFNRSQILTQLATADGRNKELQHRLTEAVACSAAEKFTHADDELTATRIVNSCLTDDIVKLRKQLDEAHAHADRLQKRLDDQPTPGRNPR